MLPEGLGKSIGGCDWAFLRLQGLIPYGFAPDSELGNAATKLRIGPAYLYALALPSNSLIRPSLKASSTEFSSEIGLGKRSPCLCEPSFSHIRRQMNQYQFIHANFVSNCSRSFG